MLAPGQTLAGYTLLRCIARGGLADVWLAQRHTGGRQVAIKVLAATKSHRPDSRAAAERRFTERLEAAKALDHPYLVKVLGGGDEAGTHYVVTEFIDAIDLEQALAQFSREGRSVSLPVAVYIIHQVGAALAHVHQHGQTHRSVAPSKILISRDRDVKLGDFASIAIAQDQVDTAADSLSTGKLAYLSPELAKDPSSPDPRSDVFALGTLFWELLTGRPLFRRSTDLETVAAVIEAKLPMPPDVIDPELRSVLDRCLAKDPGRRFADAGELVAALESIAIPPASDEELEALASAPRRQTTEAPWEVGEPLDTKAAHAKTTSSSPDTELDPSFFDEGSEQPTRRFELLERIGEGGMGEVYRARDRELDEIVALKVMARHLGQDQHLVNRMRREVRLARKISSDRVCRIYDLAELEDGSRAIAMQFVTGKTLSTLLREGFPVDYARFAAWGADVADGLVAAHALSVVHRDLKPDNVMIDDDDRAIILDFGIALSTESTKTDDKLTKQGVILGTLPYMAPEQLSAAPLCSQTDLYALGLMLAELVTGEVPFNAPDYSGLLERRVINPEPYELRRLDPGVPKTLAEVVDKLLCAKAKDRWADAEEVSRRLRSLAHSLETGPQRLDSERTSARPLASTRPIEPDPRELASDLPTEPPKPRWAGVLTVGIGLLLLGIGLVVFGRVLDRKTEPGPIGVPALVEPTSEDAGASPSIETETAPEPASEEPPRSRPNKPERPRLPPAEAM